MDGEEAKVLSGPLQTVGLSSLIDNLARSGVQDINAALHLPPDTPDEEK